MMAVCGCGIEGDGMWEDRSLSVFPKTRGVCIWELAYRTELPGIPDVGVGSRQPCELHNRCSDN